MISAVFIVRDGVLNEVNENAVSKYAGLPTTVAEFRIIREQKHLLAMLRDAGLKIVVITSQPGLSDRSLPRDTHDRMNRAIKDKFNIDDILVCPHSIGDTCDCWLGKYSLLKQASSKLRVDLCLSFVVSDCWQDLDAARAHGCMPIALQSPWLRDWGKNNGVKPVQGFDKAVARIRGIMERRQKPVE